MRSVTNWWRVGAVVCLCVTATVSCSRTSVHPYMNSSVTAPLIVPEGLSAPRASHEMDVPDSVLMRSLQGDDADVPRSEEGEALPPGLTTK